MRPVTDSANSVSLPDPPFGAGLSRWLGGLNQGTMLKEMRVSFQ
jgi:hypothetical protein